MKTVAKKTRRIKRQLEIVEMSEAEQAREMRLAAIQMLIDRRNDTFLGFTPLVVSH